MITIHKFPLEALDDQFIRIGGLIEVLSVESQREEIVLYVLRHDDIEDERGVSIRIVGTGHPMRKDDLEYKFLGTVKLLEGDLMFHVFYKKL